MNIAILGAGAMAKGLATQLSRSGYSVVLGARDRNKAADAAAEIGRGVQAASFRGAASAADIIVLATPYAAASDVLSIAGDLSGKVIIDITNPMTPDFSGLAIGHTSSAAEEIQKAAPGAHVVKAFNTIFAHLLTQPKPGAKRLTVFYAGDNAEANERVRALIDRLGFRPQFAGPLKHARYLEPMAALNIAFGYALGAGVNIAPEWRQIGKQVDKPRKASKRALVYELLANP
ncbi:MAG TPA: NADPH-dependent F420 reductase [Terricaulis sp.]|nr:NADPH-dependent F420 reductase [Terricaulis sp.]